MISDNKILQGCARRRTWIENIIQMPLPTCLRWGSARYIDGHIDHGARRINIAIRVNISGDASLTHIVKTGVSRYWSRWVTLNGQRWHVSTQAVDSADGLPVYISRQEARSNTGYPWRQTNVYVNSNGEQWASRAAAHEIGHAILFDSVDLSKSMTHHGTSVFMSSPNRVRDDAPAVPVSGEIDLMRYYTGDFNLLDFANRAIASEDDVKRLVYISGR